MNDAENDDGHPETKSVLSPNIKPIRLFNDVVNNSQNAAFPPRRPSTRS